jgi:hypothetical protein
MVQLHISLSSQQLREAVVPYIQNAVGVCKHIIILILLLTEVPELLECSLN